jgi:hypothetical protein
MGLCFGSESGLFCDACDRVDLPVEKVAVDNALSWS